MNIFVTGATGFIGSAIVQELLSHGYQVTGLSRTAAGAAKLRGQGARAKIGRLDQLDLLRAAAAEADGVIHTAFIHGLQHMDFRTRVRLFAGAFRGGIGASFMRILFETESRAVEALGSALAGSGKPLVIPSGVLQLPEGRLSKETDQHIPGRLSRAFSEAAALSFVPRNVRVAIIRLAPTVHGRGDHGLIPQIIQSARKKKTSAYIGDGSNRWPAVHRLDAARLFRLALEKSQSGAIYHGVAEQGFPFKQIAEVIGRKLQLPATSCTPQQAAKHFGFLSGFVGLDTPASSNWTQATLGWKPEHPGLFEDLANADYFSQVMGTD